MKLDRLSGVRLVSEIACEMKASIISLAGERSWGETRQRWLERAARSAGISFRSAKSLFYAEDHEPRASTVEKVRRAKEAREREAQGRDEFAELQQRVAQLEAALARPENSMRASLSMGRDENV